MSQVTVVANGVDNYISALAMLGGSPLEDRINLALSEYDRVLNLSIEEQSRLFSIWGGTYPFQASITLDTQSLPATKEAVAERINLAIYTATGHLPTAVAITSAGETAPTKPAAGTADRLTGLIDRVADGLNVTVDAAKWIIVALALGLVYVIYWLASNPKRARALA